MPHDRYENPLISRYASAEMAELFSPQRKFSTWRRIWIALAQAQQELGLGVTAEQIDQLQEHVDNIDFDAARQYENKLRHDVMAHVHAYGDVCPDARPIIHLGATSCFVTDNTDLIILREALVAVRSRVAAVIDQLGTFAAETQNLATLGFTHLQPAQPTTVGKRACLWAYDLALDLKEVAHRIEQLQARSTKGTTGTQASFLKLFDGDHGKVKALESSVAEKLGFATIEDLLLDWENDHVENWDANDLLAKLATWQANDISFGPHYKNDIKNALRSIRARTILIPCTQDLYFRPEDNLVESQYIPHAEIRPYDSPWGHCAANPGNDRGFEVELDRGIKDLLK